MHAQDKLLTGALQILDSRYCKFSQELLPAKEHDYKFSYGGSIQSEWSTSIPGLAHSVLNFWVGITVISKHVSTSVKFVTLNLQENPLDDYSFHLFVLPEDGSIHGCISKLGLFCKLRR